jgi:asparagine synthase (glutamine-hydrolysing)
MHNEILHRCDRTTMAASLEARVPFLDVDFLHAVMAVDPELKRQQVAVSSGSGSPVPPPLPAPAPAPSPGGAAAAVSSGGESPSGSMAAAAAAAARRSGMEKAYFRSLVADFLQPPGSPELVPQSVLWRSKTMFGDGVDLDNTLRGALERKCAEHVTDEAFASRHSAFPRHTPRSKQEFFCRATFERFLPCDCALDAVGCWAGEAGGAPAWAAAGDVEYHDSECELTIEQKKHKQAFSSLH